MVISSFIKGLKTGFQFPKVVSIVYIFQLMLTLAIAFQVYQVMEASIGDSLELKKLLLGYDNTVVTDFLNIHGASITPLLGQIRWIVLFYFVFVIFINGGVIYSILQKKDLWQNFWKGGALYFVRFFKLAIVYLIFYLIWALVIWAPFIAFFPSSPEILSSEKVLIWMGLALLLFYFIGMIFLLNCSLHSRLIVQKQGLSTWSAVKYSIGINIRKIIKMMGLSFLFSLLLCALFILYLLVGDQIQSITTLWIIVIIAIQQLFSIIKIMWRVMFYSGHEMLLDKLTST